MDDLWKIIASAFRREPGFGCSGCGPAAASLTSTSRNRSKAAKSTSWIRSYDPIEPSLNSGNVFVDFLGRKTVVAATSFDSDGEPLTVHQHCIEGPAVIESDIRIDNLLDGTRH